MVAVCRPGWFAHLGKDQRPTAQRPALGRVGLLTERQARRAAAKPCRPATRMLLSSLGTRDIRIMVRSGNQEHAPSLHARGLASLRGRRMPWPGQGVKSTPSQQDEGMTRHRRMMPRSAINTLRAFLKLAFRFRLQVSLRYDYDDPSSHSTASIPRPCMASPVQSSPAQSKQTEHPARLAHS